MQLAELSKWIERSLYPALLLSEGRLVATNPAARRLIKAADNTPLTLMDFQTQLPGLIAPDMSTSDGWTLPVSGSGDCYHVQCHQFWDSVSSSNNAAVLEIVPLAWRNAPVGFNAGWFNGLANDSSVLPLLFNVQTRALSAPGSTLNALGLEFESNLADLWRRIRPTDLIALEQCVDSMQAEQWRVSETLGFYLRNMEGSDWARWQIELRRCPPMRDGDQWLMASLSSLDMESGERTATKHMPVSGKVGAGSLMVIQLMGLRDFIESNNADLGQALSNQFLSLVMALLGEKDRGWKLSDDNLALWFSGDTRGRRSDELWESLLSALERPLTFRDMQHRARVRAGRARAVNPESRADQLIERALAGLMESKAGTVTQANAQTDKTSQASKTTRRKQNQLLADFDEGRYRMIYQPIAHPNDLADPVGVEALSRSVSASGELFSGGDIVQAAQRHDFVREWTLWGLNQVFSDMSGWLAQRPDRFVTFNVMPSLLSDPASQEWLVNQISHLPDTLRQRLNLEITEQAIGNLIHRDVLSGLRDLGVALYLDDFGAGDSNLYRLIDIKPEAIKLDRFLIELIMDDEPQLEVLAQVLSLARTISPTIIAEGIETEAQFNLVRQLDVDLVQGYYLGRRLNLETGETLGSLLPSS